MNSVLILPSIEKAYNDFYKREGRAPNVLLIHPEANWELQEEMQAKGIFNCISEIEHKIRQYHGMNIYRTPEVKDFRLGWMA